MGGSASKKSAKPPPAEEAAAPDAPPKKASVQEAADEAAKEQDMAAAVTPPPQEADQGPEHFIPGGGGGGGGNGGKYDDVIPKPATTPSAGAATSTKAAAPKKASIPEEDIDAMHARILDETEELQEADAQVDHDVDAMLADTEDLGGHQDNQYQQQSNPNNSSPYGRSPINSTSHSDMFEDHRPRARPKPRQRPAPRASVKKPSVMMSSAQQAFMAQQHAFRSANQNNKESAAQESGKIHAATYLDKAKKNSLAGTSGTAPGDYNYDVDDAALGVEDDDLDRLIGDDDDDETFIPA